MNKKKKFIEGIDYAITIRKRKKFTNTKKITFFVFCSVTIDVKQKV